MTRRSGFTLVELLAAVTIVGTMAGLLLPALLQAREKSRVAVCVGNLRQLGQAAHVYHDDWGVLPTARFSSGYLLWNGAEYVLYAQLLPRSGRSLAHSFYCPSARTFAMRDSATGIQNLGVAGRVTAGNYSQRGQIQGAPTTLDRETRALVADLGDDGGITRNHPTGLNVLYSDSSVRFVALAGPWGFSSSATWSQLDDGGTPVTP